MWRGMHARTHARTRACAHAQCVFLGLRITLRSLFSPGLQWLNSCLQAYMAITFTSLPDSSPFYNGWDGNRFGESLGRWSSVHPVTATNVKVHLHLTCQKQRKACFWRLHTSQGVRLRTEAFAPFILREPYQAGPLISLTSHSRKVEHRQVKRHSQGNTPGWWYNQDLNQSSEAPEPVFLNATPSLPLKQIQCHGETHYFVQLIYACEEL